MTGQQTGVYSNQQILEAHGRGEIVIEPFNENAINGSSVDVCLGDHFYIITPPELKSAVFNPYDPDQINDHLDGPHTAKTVEEISDTLRVEEFRNIPPEMKAILLQPGQRILGHTLEFIGIKPPGTSSMQARSTVGRLGVNVCQDAGWGDPGYINRWTMEIYNNNERDKILLVVGTRIAQLVFYHTGAVVGEYTELSGHYQSTSSDDLERLKAEWQPSDMLPKPLTLE